MDRFSYIGICDFPNGEQSLKSAQLFQKLCEEHGVQNHKLMIGAMMSFKTLTGAPSKWTNIFPKKEELAGIFIDHPAVFNTLHYADYEDRTLTSQLVEAAEWGGPQLHAVQLDMIWPYYMDMVKLKRWVRNPKVILQVNTNALQRVGDRPDLLVEKLKEYEGAIDYILLDKSHGRGVGMNADVLLPFARAVAEYLPWLGIAGAGGLGPGSVKLIEPLKKAVPTISWDAQGKLRPSGNAMDPIEWPMADQYLLESVQLCSLRS